MTKWLVPRRRRGPRSASEPRARAPGRPSERARPALPDGRRGAESEPRLHGASFPFATTGCAGRYSIGPRVPMYVSSPTSTAPTGDADCRRAAVLTTSPATKVSPRSGLASRATIASPVFTATRSWSPSSLGPVADRECGAHCALGVVAVASTGAPNTPMTASPTNFSTLPPMTLELAADALVVGDEERANVLGVELLGAGGEAHEVDEQHRDDPPLLARRPGLPERRRRTRCRTSRRRGSPGRSART